MDLHSTRSFFPTKCTSPFLLLKYLLELSCRTYRQFLPTNSSQKTTRALQTSTEHTARVDNTHFLPGIWWENSCMHRAGLWHQQHWNSPHIHIIKNWQCPQERQEGSPPPASWRAAWAGGPPTDCPRLSAPGLRQTPTCPRSDTSQSK